MQSWQRSISTPTRIHQKTVYSVNTAESATGKEQCNIACRQYTPKHRDAGRKGSQDRNPDIILNSKSEWSCKWQSTVPGNHPKIFAYSIFKLPPQHMMTIIRIIPGEITQDDLYFYFSDCNLVWMKPVTDQINSLILLSLASGTKAEKITLGKKTEG